LENGSADPYFAGARESGRGRGGRDPQNGSEHSDSGCPNDAGIVSATVAERRFQMALTALFALVALLLGAVGIYGVVSYTVTCRTREIGLRIALGAMRKDILGWVLSHGMRPVLIGLAAGLASAGAIAFVLRSLLFGIAPVDPLSLGTVTLVLALTASLACYLPARRAARLDPMATIRQE
jgi:putative ABC transport system permease protein